ncbi:exonuclease domain-containing protein [Dysgonomonas termitidis]|uniref:Exonuclease domain-containing protein n=1 Tax=Dysgonomonas termitidis TaxID=1516126 RepID=A0ABV9KV25_9BACT
MEHINFTAIDFETAYGQKHACALGLVVVRNGRIVEEKEFLIQPPGNEITVNCQRIHRITPDMTRNAPTFAGLWPEIKQYFERQVIVHHSDGFDERILLQEFDFYNITPCRFLSMVSTMNLFDDRYSRSLENLCRAFDIPMENHHNALSDAKCCTGIFLRYLNGENPNYSILPKKNKTKQTFSEPGRVIESAAKVQDLGCVTNKETIFYDKKVVISGVFDRYPLRNDLALLLKGYGSDINGSISSKTNIFVVGKDSGPKKMEKVFELNDQGYNIQILEEEQLYKLLDEINHG